MDIKGEKVLLKPLTRELCHEIYKSYVADPIMMDEAYEYSVEVVVIIIREKFEVKVCSEKAYRN